ncbi:colicin transporter [Sphingomonas flavalba]|uniref:colicin transporter n=1 Tax=Sphingomonas flavalba TaxID=2559804 RepID=UPI0039E05888
MIAHRLRPIGWILAVAVAALVLYLISSRVAAERGRLDAVNAEISRVNGDIRHLQTELAARGSLRQLERWNGEVLALSAPSAEQYRNEVQLASLQVGPAAKTPNVVQVALVSAEPAVRAAMPVVARAVETRRTSNAGPADPSGGRPDMLRAAAQIVPARPDAAPQARLQRVAMLDAGTLDDLSRRAAREAHEAGGR